MRSDRDALNPGPVIRCRDSFEKPIHQVAENGGRLLEEVAVQLASRRAPFPALRRDRLGATGMPGDGLDHHVVLAIIRPPSSCEICSMTRTVATAIGFAAVLMWSLLALLTAASGNVPPFQLAAISFAIGGAIGAASWIARPSRIVALRQPPAVWLLGIGGLFGYHFAYFTALRNAPPVDASLIAFLWPLLIVLLSALLPGEKLRVHHVAGALLGLAGAALIVTKGSAVAFESQYAFGYAMALACALIWSSYSVLSRRFAAVPTDVVTGFCLASALLAAIAHVFLEATVWPSNAGEWLATVGLGLGPVGLAFYVWDFGVKHGDIQVLGASSYLAPLFSTLILVLTGYASLTWVIGMACLLITGGAALAAKELFARRSARHQTRATVDDRGNVS